MIAPIPTPNSYVKVLAPGTSKCDHIWRKSLYRGNKVKMRTLVWALLQYDWCPYKRGNRYLQKEDRVKTQREDGHLQAKDRDLEQVLPSQLSEGTNRANILILNFQPPELRDSTFLLLRPPVCGSLLWQLQNMNTDTH